jgi:hypothetical protein
MPPKRKAKRRSPRFTGFRVTDTLFDFYDADQLTTLFSGQGVIPTFISPFMPGRDYKAGIDGALDIKEVWQGLTQTGLFAPGSKAGGAWVGNWSGSPAVAEVGLGGVIMKNIQANAVPVALKLTGAKVVKKILTKSGLRRRMNALTRRIGMGSIVRW